ncbi:hypothetical protein II810_00450 [bacterium]|nr:hypothetical protein [bacterium]
MFGNLGNTADLLAQNKILNFDAAAYLTDTPPRFVGNPTGPVAPFVMPNTSNPTETKLKNQAEIDEFKKEVKEGDREGKLITPKVPAWKKAAFSILAIGTLVFCAMKCKSVYGWIKGKLSKSKPTP